MPSTNYCVASYFDAVFVAPARHHGVTRRVPEFALLTGVFLGLSLGGFALWATGDLHQSVLVGAFLAYPFAGYAVRVDDDPTGVLLPWVVGSGALLAGVVVAGDVVLQARDEVGAAVTRGVFLGGLVAVPPAAYAVGHDDRLGPPARPTLAVAGLLAVALPVAGTLVGSWYGAASGPLLALPLALYAAGQGALPAYRTRLLAVAGGLVVGAGLVTAAVTGRVATLPALVAATATLATPAAYTALTRRFTRRSRSPWR